MARIQLSREMRSLMSLSLKTVFHVIEEYYDENKEIVRGW